MKKTIRFGVWETNSSSVHAIAIPKKNVIADKLNINPKIHFKHGMFGWEHALYDSVNNRASYLYQAIFDLKCPYISPAIRQKNQKADMSEEDFKKYKTEVKEFNQKRKEFNKAINWIYEVLTKHGFFIEFDNDDYDEYGWANGYIDHSEGLDSFVDYILYNEKHLLTYLFGDTQICTSNDNGDMEDIENFTQNHPEKNYMLYLKYN